MNATFDVLSFKNAKPTGQKISVPEELAKLKPNKSLLHEAILLWQSNQRQGTVATKTRSEVSGGGRKPWKQKHTGRARSGSNRSPLWRKGGVTFGPQPRDYSWSMPETKKNLALAHAIANRLNQTVVFIKEEEMGSISKTKEVAGLLGAIPRAQTSGTTLVVMAAPTDSIYRASRNLPKVQVARASALNAFQLLKAGRILFTDAAWEKYLETRYHGV